MFYLTGRSTCDESKKFFLTFEWQQFPLFRPSCCLWKRIKYVTLGKCLVYCVNNYLVNTRSNNKKKKEEEEKEALNCLQLLEATLMF